MVSNGVVSVPVSIDGAMTMPFLIDTGAVLTRLDPTRFAALAITPGLAQVSTLDVGNVHLTEVEVVAASLCGVGMMCPAAGPAGLLGGAVMNQLAVTIDYRRSAVTFGAFTVPAGAGAPVTVPFALEGGGSATVGDAALTVPATRIAVDVNIEGMALPMIVDTGSSTMVIEPALYDKIVADGRSQSTADLATVTGTQSVPSTKLHTVTVAGAAQANVAAVRSPLDLSVLAREVGHPVKGLVGGAYLENYLTTIDYPARQITLRPY
jgi:predicted aspartyl protease